MKNKEKVFLFFIYFLMWFMSGTATIICHERCSGPSVRFHSNQKLGSFYVHNIIDCDYRCFDPVGIKGSQRSISETNNILFYLVLASIPLFIAFIFSILFYKEFKLL